MKNVNDSMNRTVDFSKWNSLGFYNYYYSKIGSEIKLYDSFENALDSYKLKTIDPVAIIEIIAKGYCFGDRTLIKNIHRTPWMARPNIDNTKWDYFTLPAHECHVADVVEIANRLADLLKNEIVEICRKRHHIGILLSGGMDSRITAGMMYGLARDGKISEKVTAITWGVENSRDVVYSKEIARRYGWQWEHVNMTNENLLENIGVAEEIGCEVSPVHLHAIPEVRQIQGLDCIIASSFGDSVGRGVFSSRHITQLKSIALYVRNWFYLVKGKAFKQLFPMAINDLSSYRNYFRREKECHYMEIEQEAHYMRRMLNPCIGLINSHIPTAQTFTSAEVYGYMWSLPREVRTDNIYAVIMEKYIKELNDIPWSKTGIQFAGDTGAPDHYLKNYHHYHKWINQDLFDQLIGEIDIDTLDRIGIFNNRALMNALFTNRKIDTEKLTRIDGLFVWLSSVIRMMRKRGISGTDLSISNDLLDGLKARLSGAYIYLVENCINLGKNLR